MKDFSPSCEVIDKKIINIIDDTLFNNNIDIDLGQLYIVLKHTFNYLNFTIKFNNKVRNIGTYLHKKHKSLSQFIKNNTKYKIVEQDGLHYISS